MADRTDKSGCAILTTAQIRMMLLQLGAHFDTIRPVNFFLNTFFYQPLSAIASYVVYGTYGHIYIRFQILTFFRCIFGYLFVFILKEWRKLRLFTPFGYLFCNFGLIVFILFSTAFLKFSICPKLSAQILICEIHIERYCSADFAFPFGWLLCFLVADNWMRNFRLNRICRNNMHNKNT